MLRSGWTVVGLGVLFVIIQSCGEDFGTGRGAALGTVVLRGCGAAAGAGVAGLAQRLARPAPGLVQGATLVGGDLGGQWAGAGAVVPAAVGVRSGLRDLLSGHGRLPGARVRFPGRGRRRHADPWPARARPAAVRPPAPLPHLVS